MIELMIINLMTSRKIFL